MESFFSGASFLSFFERDTPTEEPDPDPNYVSVEEINPQQTLLHRLDPSLLRGGICHGIHREGNVNAMAFEQEGIGEDGLEGACRYPDFLQTSYPKQIIISDFNCPI